MAGFTLGIRVLYGSMAREVNVEVTNISWRLGETLNLKPYYPKSHKLYQMADLPEFVREKMAALDLAGTNVTLPKIGYTFVCIEGRDWRDQHYKLTVTPTDLKRFKGE